MLTSVIDGPNSLSRTHRIPGILNLFSGSNYILESGVVQAQADKNPWLQAPFEFGFNLHFPRAIISDPAQDRWVSSTRPEKENSWFQHHSTVWIAVESEEYSIWRVQLSFPRAIISGLTHLTAYKNICLARAWCTVHSENLCGNCKLQLRPGFDSLHPNAITAVTIVEGQATEPAAAASSKSVQIIDFGRFNLCISRAVIVGLTHLTGYKTIFSTRVWCRVHSSSTFGPHRYSTKVLVAASFNGFNWKSPKNIQFRLFNLFYPPAVISELTAHIRGSEYTLDTDVVHGAQQLPLRKKEFDVFDCRPEFDSPHPNSRIPKAFSGKSNSCRIFKIGRFNLQLRFPRMGPLTYGRTG
ncbi:hypothetical protein C8R43DRAFT_960477 [Mycena crocata]|nr:hypothetical protein C8R43DRAFT_960477 [Mycena crocata]